MIFTRLPADLPGLPHFAQVSPTLFRGARPNRIGLAHLQEMKVEIVVDLEAWFDFNPCEWFWASKNLVTYKNLPCSPWHPEMEDIDAFLDETKKGVVFVHCKQGCDRTGYIVAAYRVLVMGWSKEDAIAEMRAFGLHEKAWPEIVPFIQRI
jgi:protein tyrosine phosphatase